MILVKKTSNFDNSQKGDITQYERYVISGRANEGGPRDRAPQGLGPTEMRFN